MKKSKGSGFLEFSFLRTMDVSNDIDGGTLISLEFLSSPGNPHAEGVLKSKNGKQKYHLVGNLNLHTQKIEIKILEAN